MKPIFYNRNIPSSPSSYTWLHYCCHYFAVFVSIYLWLPRSSIIINFSITTSSFLPFLGLTLSHQTCCTCSCMPALVLPLLAALHTFLREKFPVSPCSQARYQRTNDLRSPHESSQSAIEVFVTLNLDHKVLASLGLAKIPIWSIV